MSQTVLIVGAGQAGFQCALSLRQKGFDGDVVIVGAESHPPYERPPLSKACLTHDLPAERLFFRKESFYADKAITLRLGAAVQSIDRGARRVRLADGTRLTYDALVLATGAQVRRLACPGGDLPGIVTVRTIDDTAALKRRIGPGRRLVVVGGGYIGLEVAAAARGLGTQVTLVETRERVMSRVTSEPVSRFFEDLHRAHEVDLRLGVEVAAVEGEDRPEAVRLSNGEILYADALVVGVGIVPETALAEAAGLQVDDGILVDEHARTSDPAVFAAGDCTRFPLADKAVPVRLESVQNAVDQAKAAASAITGENMPYSAVPWFWSEQYDVKLQTAGLFGPGDTPVVRGDPGTRRFSVCYVREGRLAAIDTINSLKDFTQGKRLIGEGRAVDVDRLADSSVALKDM